VNPGDESVRDEHDRVARVVASHKHPTIWLFLSGRKYIPDGFINWSNEVQLEVLYAWADSVMKQDGKWFCININ